ncbi:MlaD family protein [Legionella gresilensis]|uniref:MlaD family protein n=1 Tax=Legionella gresilensis TaxID=91823 RepID=UPI0010417794|nr:MlaD family protein [Legionella gresilensis]
MRHEPFYTLVGIFVVGGLALMFVGGLFFYQQHTQAKVQTFVMFFKGSLKGLSATTPVTYRGVKVGEVSLIEITENKIKNKVEIPVYVEFFVEKNLDFAQNPVELLIRNGFVANISSPNFLTGVAEIELVKSDVKLSNYQPSYFRGYPIFPTRNTKEKPTTITETLKSAQIMIEEITKFVRSPAFKDTITSTRRMANSFTRLSRNLDNRLPSAINSFNQLTRNLDNRLPSAINNFNRLTLNLDDYLPPAITYFNRSVKEIADAANSVENLSDYLSRHPESLLRGKS